MGEGASWSWLFGVVRVRAAGLGLPSTGRREWERRAALVGVSVVVVVDVDVSRALYRSQTSAVPF